MPDDLMKSDGRDRKRINLLEPSEVQHWSSRLGVSVDDLKEAVEAVGNEASQVEDYLRRRKQ